MALDDDIARLARQPLLGLMERDALRLVAFAAESRILRAGDVLFRVGEPSDGAMLVVSGAIALTSEDDGKPASEIVGPGSADRRDRPVHLGAALGDRDRARADADHAAVTQRDAPRARRIAGFGGGDRGRDRGAPARLRRRAERAVSRATSR